MAFVKLHRAILDSTVWMDRDVRDVFITSLLMADPRELKVRTPTIKIASLHLDEFIVPPGWYGFVRAASTGIIHRTQIARKKGMAALEVLASPDFESKSKEHDGRRMVRIDGGFIILNYFKFRERDETAAERMRRFRCKQQPVTPVTASHAVTTANVTQAEAEAEAEAERDRSEGAKRKLTGHLLCQAFSAIRAKQVGGIEWHSVRVAGGTAADMADLINRTGARADVEPTIALLFERAKAGKAGDKSAEIVRSGSFAFGAWCSQWTELREELHRKTPVRQVDVRSVEATDAKINELRAIQKAMYG